MDFHWGEYTYQIKGGNTISISKLLDILQNGNETDNLQSRNSKEEQIDEFWDNEEDEDVPVENIHNSENTTVTSDNGNAEVYTTTEKERENLPKLPSVDEIEEIEFSNPDVGVVAKVEKDTTVGEFVQSLGLVNQFTEEMTDNEINDALNAILKSGDWAFISLKSFTTEEALTITLQDGDIFTIGVTDAQGYSNVTLSNPQVRMKTGNSTGTYTSNLNFRLSTNGNVRVTQTFKNCYTGGNGGAYFAAAENDILKGNLTFENCHSTGGKGGGAYFNAAASLPW